MPVFRVVFDGPPLAEPQVDGDATGVEWEGSRGFPDNVRFRHYFLVEGMAPDAAITALRRAVDHPGAFSGFAAAEVTPPPGWKGLGEEIDWAHVATRAELTKLQETLLDNLLNSPEPTWIMLEDSDTDGDRELVEAAFRDLEQRNLVTRTREASGNPAAEPTDPEDWWALTNEAWDLLGLIKRPWYS
jgi:hypothetical protein